MSPRKREFTGQLKDADLRLLRIFRVVVDCGGFSAAEVELNISRAAISMAIGDLEARIGLKLCQRGRSGFSLTDAGTEVYEAVLQLLASVEGFRTRVNSLHKWLKGELNIGITDNLVSMPEMIITDALSALKQRGPDVYINIRMIPPNDIEVAVLKGSLHTGVIPMYNPLSGLGYLPLYSEHSQLYCSSGHPLFGSENASEAEVKQYDAVAPAYVQSPEIKKKHEALNVSASATDREGIAFLVLSGCYIGFLPNHYAERWVRDGKLKAINPALFSYDTEFCTIYSKSAPHNLVLETYLDEVKRLTLQQNKTT